MATVKLGPAVLDISGIRAGDENQIEITITKSGVPFPLTGYTVSAQARKAAIDPDPPLITAECEITDAAGGKVVTTWHGDDVMTLLNGSAQFNGVWDLQISADGVTNKTIAAGLFNAVMDVTRP